MTLLQRLRAKQKTDKLKAELRAEKRREYERAARERKRARRLAESGLEDLPDAVAVAVEAALEMQAPEEEPPKAADATVEDLVARLAAIKERIFRLHAVYAVSLSLDAAMEANRYLALFQDLAQQLEAKDADSLSTITRGFESLLLSPPFPTRRTIPLDTQKLVELRWEAMQTPALREPKPPDVPDGLDWMVG
jgi:hypothetical protein